jgi:hypothetical protein
MLMMITRAIRSYLGRDWDAARRRKDLYWWDRIKRLGPAEGFRIAEELRHQAIEMDPAWPGDEARREDLSAHARLAEVLRRADSSRRP